MPAVSNITSSKSIHEAICSSATNSITAKENNEQVSHKSSTLESLAKLKEISQVLNDLMKTKEMGLAFRVDQSSGRVVMTVIDAESGAVVRQVPSEDILRVSQSIENLRGLLFNKSL